MTPIALRKTEPHRDDRRELRDFLISERLAAGARLAPHPGGALPCSLLLVSWSVPDPRGYSEALGPLRLQVEPGENAELDDLVVIKVDFPPESGAGPVINGPDLFQLGWSQDRSSEPTLRRTLCLATGHHPPTSPPYRAVHLWSAIPRHYPVLTAADRRRLAFGTADKKNRTRPTKTRHGRICPG